MTDDVARAEATQEVRAEQGNPKPDVVPLQHRSVSPKGEKKISPPRRRWIRPFLLALLPVVLLVGGYIYVQGGQIVTTDDAYVEADKIGVSTDVSGTIKDIKVRENEHVTAGEVLLRLEPSQFQIAVDNAKANLDQTELNIESMKQDYRRMLRDIDAQQAQVELDQVTYDRAATLIKTDATPRANYDQARFTLQSDKSKVASLEQQAEVQLAKLRGNPDIAASDHPQYQQAKAQLDEAQRQLDHTVVRASFDGTVTNVSSVGLGKYLSASTVAFYLVDNDHVWVSANPKETELTYVRPGQAVSVSVDTYPDLEWQGTVESISPAAAQEFQLLPAQNTSGNWVKVVQRIPMRVRVEATRDPRPPLRAGMSVEIAVDTGHKRGLPHFLDVFGDGRKE
ncbi:HlyD family secretion protein [Bradyrhizobium sp. AZCC 2289]|uniref:HlyD family secretion protein n=1 Tax=Bradyrhizobium sp. AZCC 2289 TaxID=3117026 RepID=UPI002FEF040E